MGLFHGKTFALCLVVRSSVQLQDFYKRNKAVVDSGGLSDKRGMLGGEAQR